MEEDPNATVVVDPLPQIPGYRLRSLLGVGGMARVYLADDVKLDRSVAIKVISAAIGDEEMRHRFANEAKVVARFRHPNIVTVFSFGEHENTPFIVMDYQAGGTLESRISDGPLRGHEALLIGSKVASALAYSHERGIIHRDIKPGNILFGENDEPIITDFGIAKAIETDSHLTRTGFSIGSPRYMSPEQIQGSRVDERSDVYSLGLVIAEMLTGEVPPPGVAALPDRAAVSRNVARTIKSCLDADPAARPSAADLASALSVAAAESAARETPSRRRYLMPGIVAALGIFAGLTGWYLVAPGAPDIDLSVTPGSARVQVDNDPVRVGAGLTPGFHRITAVAPDHLGFFLERTFTAGETVALDLAPLTLPDYDEFQTFHARLVAEPGEVVNTVTYPPYSNLLNLHSAVQNGKTKEIDAWRNKILSLAALGDASARTQAFLADFENVLAVDDFDTLAWLEAASDEGFALATYYRALHFRWRYETDDGLSVNRLGELRALMQRAADQGLDFARNEVLSIDEILATAGAAVSE